MAVNDSTNISLCLYCKTSSTSSSDSEKEFHEIFDEVGLELQLPTLVEKFFHHKAINEGKQLLCDDCVNHLIELYDLEEHEKVAEVEGENDVTGIGGKEIREVTTLENVHEVDKNVEDHFDSAHNVKVFKDSDEIQFDNPDIGIPNLDVISIQEDKNVNNDQGNEILNVTVGIKFENNTEIDDPNLGEEILYELFVKKHQKTKIPKVCEYDDDHEIEPIKAVEDIHYGNADDDDISNLSEEVRKYHAEPEIKVLKDNEEAIIDLELDDDPNPSDDQEIEQNKVFEDDHYNGYGNDHERSTSHFSEEIELPKDNEEVQYYSETDDDPNTDDKQIDSIQDIEDVQYSDDDLDNDNIGVANYIEETPQHNDDQEIESQNDNLFDLTEDEDPDSDLQLVDNFVDEETTETPCEELEFILNENNFDDHDAAVASPNSETDYISSDQNDLIEEQVYDDEESLLECNSVDTLYDEMILEELIETEDDNLENKVITEVMTDCTQDENISTEEEYLVEELICSAEFDSVDLNEYLDNVLITKFETLELQWSVECKLCLEKYDSFQDLLKHACINELSEEQQSCCIFKGCEEDINNVKILARHLIINHYDKLESLPIYGRCPDCEKAFSNFIDFNKHSCCRTIKRKLGARNYCQSCNMDFQSLKRYVFHMQFHLTKHRPKLCLLCFASFNNCKDFFEHTQYNHEPETSKACVACDRFFLLDVYESHMELHKESKYSFACSYCPKKYTKKSGLSIHMDIYHNHKRKPLECEYCDKEFATNSSYRSHMKSHTFEAEIPAFVCSECGLISNNSDLMKDHVGMDKESPCYEAVIIEKILSVGYTCENCSIDFQSQTHLQKHRLSNNHSDKLFYCSICRRAFKTFRHMRNHSINHKDYEQWQEMFPIIRLYMCNVGECQESYALWTTLYYHKKKPHKTGKNIDLPTDFKCPFCEHRKCTSKMSLAVHIARSHNNANILCPHCKQSYKNKKLLQDHIDKFHTAVKCTVCLKDFKNRRNLDSHEQLVHSNDKRYFCTHCAKGYFFKSELEYHVKNVHSEISYKCEICNFITNYPKSLEIHLNKHNNKLNFKCTFCSKAFGRKQLLTVHMKRHQKTKDYVCCEYYELGCNAAYTTYNLMKTHILKKHKIPNNDNKKINIKRKKRSHLQMEVSTTSTAKEDNKNAKRRKRTSGIVVKDIEFEQNSIKLISDDELQSEMIIEYKYEINETSE